jgi:hypothetical protein
MQTSAAVIDKSSRLHWSLEREYLAGGQVKGGVLRAHVSWAREWADAAQMKALYDTLGADVRQALASVVLTTRWYPFGWLVEVQKGLVDVLGNGNRSILRQAGRYAAAANLGSVSRAFDGDEPDRFLRLTALLHTQFQDFGSATFEQTGPRQGRMIHRHNRCFSPVHCESSAGYYEQCARMHGAVEVTVEQTSCQCLGASSCVFAIEWV